MSHLSPATQKALTNIREYLAGHLPEGPPNTFTTFKFVALRQNFDMELEGLFSQPPAGHVAIEQGATVVMVGSETQAEQVGTVSLDLTSGDFSALEALSVASRTKSGGHTCIRNRELRRIAPGGDWNKLCRLPVRDSTGDVWWLVLFIEDVEQQRGWRLNRSFGRKRTC
jgi:hypothetical protein